MSDYHILEGSMDGGAETYKVAFHIPVPDETNDAAYSLRSALAEDPEVNKTSAVPWILTAEQTQLDSGELYERLESYSRNTTNAVTQDRDALDARWNTLATAIPNRLRDRYKYWHYDRDVP